MKKSTKKMIMAMIIILTFGLSSIAFVVTGFFGRSSGQERRQLESPVIDGELDPIYKDTYMRSGFTWIEFYYTEPDPLFLSFLDSLPQTFTTPSGQTQIIVQKLNHGYLNESNYIIISSLTGQESFAEQDHNKVFASLCGLLTFPPLECGFANNTETNSRA